MVRIFIRGNWSMVFRSGVSGEHAAPVLKPSAADELADPQMLPAEVPVRESERVFLRVRNGRFVLGRLKSSVLFVRQLLRPGWFFRLDGSVRK